MRNKTFPFHCINSSLTNMILYSYNTKRFFINLLVQLYSRNKLFFIWYKILHFQFINVTLFIQMVVFSMNTKYLSFILLIHVTQKIKNYCKHIFIQTKLSASFYFNSTLFKWLIITNIFPYNTKRLSFIKLILFRTDN